MITRIVYFFIRLIPNWLRMELFVTVGHYYFQNSNFWPADDGTDGKEIKVIIFYKDEFTLNSYRSSVLGDLTHGE